MSHPLRCANYAISGSVQEYVEQFKWNSVRYPYKRATLRAMVEQIVKVRSLALNLSKHRDASCARSLQDATKADADLKRQLTEFNEVRNSVSAVERKEA